MKLCRESKIGKIKNKGEKYLIGLVIGLGTVAISTSLLTKDKIDSYDTETYDSYSQQVESVLDINVNKSDEEILNEMGNSLKLIQKYDEVSDEAKDGILIELKENQENFEDLALTLVKNRVANENGGSPDDYTISNTEPGYEASNWIAVSEKSGVIELDSKSSKLIDAVSFLQGIKPEEGKKDIYVDKYKYVVNAATQYVEKMTKIEK